MKPSLPCAIYTRKSSEEGLEQGFNSLDAQREACEAYILSQKEQGWKAVAIRYDDGGFSGGNIDRPAMQRLLADILAKRIRVIVVYKVDRLTRSLADFAKLVELFDAHGVSFVSVTQQFNTTSSMGRLTLNVLLSFAQFEREVTGERIRDKIAASKKKGMWMGGIPPIGYRAFERTLVIDEPQAERIRKIYRIYLDLGNVRQLKTEVDRWGWITPFRKTRRENDVGGRSFSRGHLYRILSNPIYQGQIAHKDQIFTGQHPAIIDAELWNAVQVQLKTNLQGHRSRATAANPSLLTSLLFDDQGHRLTPTHATKGSRRYRYYVAQPFLEKGKEDEQTGLRWPAQELEDAVVKTIAECLRDEGRLVGIMESMPANEVRQRLQIARDLAEKLVQDNQPDRITLLKRLIERITVYQDRLELVLRCKALWSKLADSKPDESVTTIVAPMTLRRRGTSLCLMVRPAGGGETLGRDPNLIGLVAKGHEWFECLSSGKCSSIQDIVKAEKLSRSYVTRVIYLAFMAPDIVERIMKGAQPATLNANRLIRLGPLPLAWEEQRALLGMARP